MLLIVAVFTLSKFHTDSVKAQMTIAVNRQKGIDMPTKDLIESLDARNKYVEINIDEEKREQNLKPVSTPAPTADNSLEDLIAKHFPAYAVASAKKIMHCESGGNTNAMGDGALRYYQNGVMYGASYGLFQVRHLPGRPSPEWLKVPENNISYAAGIFKAKGTFKKDWVNCSKKTNAI